MNRSCDRSPGFCPSNAAARLMKSRFCVGLRPAESVIAKIKSRQRRRLEIVGIVDQSIRAVLGDDLEPILLRHGELFDHGAMNAVGDRPPVFVRFSGAQRNANKWHGGKVSAEDRRIYAADRTPSKSQNPGSDSTFARRLLRG